MLFDGGRVRRRHGARLVVNNPTRTISGMLALAGFSVAVMAGLWVGNPSGIVLTRALIALLACNVVGAIIGAIVHWIGSTHVERYQKNNPIPSVGSSTVPPQSGAASVSTFEKKVAA